MRTAVSRSTDRRRRSADEPRAVGALRRCATSCFSAIFLLWRNPSAHAAPPLAFSRFLRETRRGMPLRPSMAVPTPRPPLARHPPARQRPRAIPPPCGASIGEGADGSFEKSSNFSPKYAGSKFPEKRNAPQTGSIQRISCGFSPQSKPKRPLQHPLPHTSVKNKQKTSPTRPATPNKQRLLLLNP